MLPVQHQRLLYTTDLAIMGDVHANPVVLLEIVDPDGHGSPDAVSTFSMVQPVMVLCYAISL